MSTHTAPSVGLIVEFTQKVRVNHKVNLDAFFAAMTVREQADYRAVDLHEFGFEAEYERPLAYLTSLSDVEGHTILGGRRGATEAIESDYDLDASVQSRDGTRPTTREGRNWSEDDFNALAATTPWRIKPGPTWEDMTPEERDDALRAPGPNDVPLIGLG